ncbi:hypothetical protein QAD02_011845 [Eretmocerus hayati]|uniref:Uncharacterized protein n=1 Tax=Eretmocerus hayati TaxID=131215 RepID=A0ACC2NXQ0_9HYME|nr:hypothetical protein QAD02_011845 [Eretmocerus hayati]
MTSKRVNNSSTDDVMQWLSSLWSVFGLNTDLPKECNPLSSKQEEYLVSEGISVPSDYCYISGSGIYKLHEDLATWKEARSICKSEGGRLAILKSKEAADVLAQMFRNSDLMYEGDKPSKGVFLGFHDIDHEGEFVTIQGQPLEETGFNEWSPEWDGQPDNGLVIGQSAKSQNCGALAYDGKLDDVGCSWKLGYVCEIPLRKKHS